MHPEYRGIPIPLFSVSPDWREDLLFRELDRTLIHEALDLSEERWGTRPRPLYGLRYRTTTLSAGETGYIRRVLELAQALPVAIPVWQEEVQLLAAAALSETTLEVPDVTDSLWTVLNTYALLWNAFNQWEFVEIEEITETEIILAQPLEGNWAEGTRIYPLLIGKLTRDPHTNLVSDHASYRVDFEERFNGITEQGISEADLPELELLYSECLDECTLLWAYREGSLNVVEIAESPAGPWFDYIYFQPTAEQVANGSGSVRLNNDFGGARWFRVTVGGAPITRAANPDPALIEPPILEEIANVSEIDTRLWYVEDSKDVPTLGAVRGMQHLGLHYRPYSYIENQFIQPGSDLYLEPKLRFEMEMDVNWDGRTNEVTWAARIDGAVIKYTINRSDPQEDTANPKIDRIADNIGAYRPAFGLVIKARAFRDGCKSPVFCFLVDANHIKFQRMVRNASLWQMTSGLCTLPYDVSHLFGAPPGSGTVIFRYGPADCENVYGGIGPYEEQRIASTCGQRQSIESSEARDRVTGEVLKPLFIHRDERIIGAGIHWLGYPTHNMTYAPLTFVAVSAVYRSPYLWDNSPACFTNPRVGISAGAGSVFTYESGTIAMAGAGGSEAELIQILTGIFDNYKKSCGAEGNVWVEDMQLIRTAHDDFPPLPSDGIAPEPGIEPQPNPEQEPYLQNQHEDFEQYPQGFLVEPGESIGEIAAEGEFWAGPWRFLDYSQIAHDDCEDYGLDRVLADREPLFQESPLTWWLHIWENRTYPVAHEDFEDFDIGEFLGGGVPNEDFWAAPMPEPAGRLVRESFETYPEGYNVWNLNSVEFGLDRPWGISDLEPDSPDNYGSLWAWWEADGLALADEDPVETVPDLSGNSRDLSQAVLANRPLFKEDEFGDMPGFSFPIAEERWWDFSDFALGLGDDFTFIVIGKFPDDRASATGMPVLGNSSVNRSLRVLAFGGPFMSYHDGTNELTKGFSTLATPKMLVWRRSSGTVTMTDMLSPGTGAADAAFTLNQFGKVSFGATLEGQVAAAALFSGALSAAEMETLYYSYFYPKFIK